MEVWGYMVQCFMRILPAGLLVEKPRDNPQRHLCWFVRSSCATSLFNICHAIPYRTCTLLHWKMVWTGWENGGKPFATERQKRRRRSEDLPIRSLRLYSSSNLPKSNTTFDQHVFSLDTPFQKTDAEPRWNMFFHSNTVWSTKQLPTRMSFRTCLSTKVAFP